MNYNLAIIGGGASGLMAAISASMHGISNIVIIEKSARVGRKLSATGNGQGNITNANMDIGYFHSGDIKKAESILLDNQNKINEVFASLGLLFTEEENGCIYPYSYQASNITDVLRFECIRRGVNIITEKEVNNIKYCAGKESEFLISDTGSEETNAKCVIIATGGSVAPSFGTDGSSYMLLKNFHHSFTPILPSLVQLKTDITKIKGLKGIKRPAIVSVMSDNTVIKSIKGEILFTDYGVSGNAVFAVSGYAIREFEKRPVTICIDFMPEYKKETLITMFTARKNLISLTTEYFFTGVFNKILGRALLNEAGITDINKDISAITMQEIARIVDTVKCFQLKMTGDTGFKNAQVTIGGADMREFTKELESIKQKGLFACGEILDVDGDCGGYNLCWAWMSGYKAGQSAKDYLNNNYKSVIK